MQLYPGNPLATLADKVSVGQVALVLARLGVGKTAFLVHAALAELLDGRQVLHVALTQTVDHARAHYDELLRSVPEPGPAASMRIERGRQLARFDGLDLDGIARLLDVLGQTATFSPTLWVIDGLCAGPELAAQIAAVRALATERGAVAWISVQSDAPLPDDVFAAAAVVVRLVPDGGVIRLHGVHGVGTSATRTLDPGTLLAWTSEGGGDEVPDRLQARSCTVYSGGAAGSEAAFGAAAERHGLQEVNLTFAGHLQTRSQGRYELSPQELAMGDVSLAYVSRSLGRTYNDTGGLIRGVLQTLWHMVSRSQQVFVVGTIQQDGTVRGGTGWSVELARTWCRELWVFDVVGQRWFRWDGHAWAAGQPKITAPHVCGTGTRRLPPSGQAAIDTLFADSFRPPEQ